MNIDHVPGEVGEVVKPSLSTFPPCTVGQVLRLWRGHRSMLVGVWKAAQPRLLGVLSRVRLTAPRPPLLPRPVHLHPFGVHTPALLPPHVTLHWRVTPRVLALREVGSSRVVDVGAQQDFLLLQLAEGQAYGHEERCHSGAAGTASGCQPGRT